MKSKLIYFARPISCYGNKQDLRDIQAIQSLGFDVLDITKDEIQQKYKSSGMSLFTEMVKSCEAVFFRACLNGKIPAGVVKEIEQAKSIGIPVFEIPTLITSRVMTVDETREYLSEVGQR